MRGETALSRELRAHRAMHQECDVRCEEYLNIARKYTEQRQIWAGPRMAHTELSVMEQH